MRAMLLDSPAPAARSPLRLIERDDPSPGPGELVLAVVRHGEIHRFDQGRVGVLQRGDHLVVVRAVPGTARPASRPATTSVD